MERGSQAAQPQPMLATAGAAASLFPAGGRMAEAIVAYDWSTSTLGPIDGWSPVLRNTVGLMLATHVEAVLFWGPEFIALYNDAYLATIGARHPRALGRPARENWAELWADLGRLLDGVRTTGATYSARNRPFYQERDGVGATSYFDISYSAVREADGTIAGVFCLVTDTTGRVMGERQAIADRERLAAMFEQAPSFMALLREPGHVFELVNRSYQQLVGHRPVTGKTVAAALPELVDQGFLQLLDEVARTGRPYTGRNIPVMLQRLPGGATEERRLDFVYQPIVDGDGHVTGIFLEGNDVTERRVAEDRLALSESALRLATDAAEIGTWDLDPRSGALRWDERTRAMFGIASDVAVKLDDFYAALHPDDLKATSAAFAAALDPERRATYDVEYRTIGRGDGALRWVAAKGRGVFVGNVCVRAVGTTIDITERRRTEGALRESEGRFRSLADSAPALIWMCDAQGGLIFANRWHEETFGRAAIDLMGDAWQSIIHPDDLGGFAAAFDAAFASRAAFQRDVRVIDRHGDTRWLHSEARPRFFEGLFVGYVGCDVDVTDTHLAAEALERGIAERTRELAVSNQQLSAQIAERERVEATLGRMQRLEAIGQLTSGVAHDFNNLLTVILGNVDMVEQMVGLGGTTDRAQARLGHIRTAAQRGATLTAQLLAFSRRQRLAARATDLNAAVTGMRDLLQSSMGGSVRLSIALQPGLWPALVDPTQIELIILNLAINARDAMAVGGSLAVTTANLTLGDPVQPEEPPAGDYVMVAVADDGSGMTAEVLAKAFEPFFTTKPVGKGSGLGLAQVFGFARQSGGGVAIETEVGTGTTVRVFLPRSTDAGEAAPPAADARATPGRVAAGKRVLLVDDDPPVRDVCAATLRTFGSIVTEAGGGAEALTILDRVAGAFDLLVVDFAMPGMNGAELAEVVGRRWPRLPVLFVTGYADLTAIAAVDEARIVQKPYRSEDLERKVERLLAGG